MIKPIPLVRSNIDPYWRKTHSANPSLLMQKGLKDIEHPEAKKSTDETKKSAHLKTLANLPTSDVYKRAFKRWFDRTSDSERFSQLAMKLDNRLLIGLSGSGALETGCALSHGYGMPYIPGSSIKGTLRAWAQQHYSDDHQAEIEQLLGRDVDDEKAASQDSLAGMVTFYDAWWIPNTQHTVKPFALDVVTTHHLDYYSGNGKPATDLDSPVPNHLLAAQGSFLFVMEGHPEHLKICQKMLQDSLKDNGIGAKNAAGYGYMQVDDNTLTLLQQQHQKELIKQKEIRDRQNAEREQQAEAQLSLEFKILRGLQKQIDQQKENNKCDSAAPVRRELKEAIEQAATWNEADKQKLLDIALECIKYWDPKSKNGKLKALKKAAQALI